MNFDYENSSLFLDKQFHFLTGAATAFLQDANPIISSAFRTPQAISIMKTVIYAIAFFSSTRKNNPEVHCLIGENTYQTVYEKNILQKLKSNTANQNIINIVKRRIKIHSITKGIVSLTKYFLIQKIGSLAFHILKKENPINLLFIGMHILSINYIFTLISYDCLWESVKFNSLTDKIAECAYTILKIDLESKVEQNHTLESIYIEQF